MPKLKLPSGRLRDTLLLRTQTSICSKNSKLIGKLLKQKSKRSKPRLTPPMLYSKSKKLVRKQETSLMQPRKLKESSTRDPLRERLNSTNSMELQQTPKKISMTTWQRFKTSKLNSKMIQTTKHCKENCKLPKMQPKVSELPSKMPELP